MRLINKKILRRSQFFIVLKALLNPSFLVKITTYDNKILETSQLYYDQKNEWFFTEKPFKYTDELGGYLEGPGVDFSKDFKVFNMQRSNGEVNSID